MALAFSSNLITCLDVTLHEIQNVEIGALTQSISFIFRKKIGNNMVEFNPRSSEYSFATKVFKINFELGQINLNDQFDMQIDRS